MVFTKHGVLMLSNVLNSKKAISVNIQIMRIFTRITKSISDTQSINVEIEKIKKKLYNQDKNIELVFDYLEELMTDQEEEPIPRNQIGYQLNKSKLPV